MRVTLVTRLLDKYSTCPNCDSTIMTNQLEVNEDKFEIWCNCGWSLSVNEDAAEELV